MIIDIDKNSFIVADKITNGYYDEKTKKTLIYILGSECPIQILDKNRELYDKVKRSIVLCELGI